jgi:hypothetical protein
VTIVLDPVEIIHSEVVVVVAVVTMEETEAETEAFEFRSEE